MSQDISSQPDCTWSVWPAQQRPFATISVLVLILGVSWYGYASLDNIMYSLVALLFLTGALNFFLFPTTYQITPEGVEAHGLLQHRKRAWSDFACYLQAETYVALSIKAEPDEQSISRGMILRYKTEDAELVINCVAAYLPEWKPPKSKKKKK